MYIIDEAEEKGSVQWSTISYQKANLNLPDHDLTLFQSHRGDTATSSAFPAGSCKLRHNLPASMELQRKKRKKICVLISKTEGLPKRFLPSHEFVTLLTGLMKVR